MSLDTSTVSFILVLVLCLECGILTALWAIHRNIPGPGYWACGAFAIAIGVLAFYLRGNLPIPLSVLAINAVIYVGFISSWWGSEAFFGRALPYRLTAALVAVALAGLLYFSLVNFNLRPRISFLMSLNALVAGLRSYSMMRELHPGTRLSQLLAGIPLVVQSLFYLAVAVAIWRLPPSTAPVTQLSIAGWIFLVPLLMSIVIVYAAVLLVGQTIAVKLQDAARRDALTDALTRRAMDEDAETEIARSRRHGTPLSLLMLDIDHFKTINDDHGHPVGDDVLRQFSAAIRHCLRREDSFARLGGEEFCALLPNTPLAGATQLAERIRVAIEALTIETGSHRLSLRVSVGIASLGEHGDTWPDLVRQADAALYAAKRAGRNRVVVAGS